MVSIEYIKNYWRLRVRTMRLRFIQRSKISGFKTILLGIWSNSIVQKLFRKYILFHYCRS